MPFPVPRTGSEHWRAYLQQRREYGDAQTGCPDTICEAEALFEITGSYNVRAPSELGDYKTLQLLQNRDWAKRIAQSVSEENSLRDPDDALEKLDHALELDPDCIAALCHRARLLIQTRHFSRAGLDISRLDGLRRTTLSEAATTDGSNLGPTIDSLNALLRYGLDASSDPAETRGCGRYRRRRASYSPIESTRQQMSNSRSHKRHQPSEQRRR